MILVDHVLEIIKPVSPFVQRTVTENGLSYGLSAAGYDVRTKQGATMLPQDFVLLSTVERFEMPDNIIAFVHDKSTWARRGIAVQNTVIEPGWCGYLTLEITNHSKERITIQPGDPIAQVVFHGLKMKPNKPYDGKYQNQEDEPVQAR